MRRPVNFWATAYGIALIALIGVATASPRPFRTTGRELNAALAYARSGVLAQAQPLTVTATLQNAATATGNGASIGVRGLAVAGVQITGTFAATITFEATVDGTNYVGIAGFPYSGTGVGVTTATAPGAWTFPINGATLLRARISAYTSGAVTVTAVATTAGSSTATGSGGGGGGGAVTSVDGGLVTVGAVADAKVTGDNAGTLSAKARGTNYYLGSVTDLVNGWFNVNLASALASGTDSIRPIASSGDYADGSIVTLGANADAAVGDASGTANAHLRQMAKILTANLPALGQAVMASSSPVVIASNQSAVPASQSGTWTVQPGNTANTTAWKVDGSAVTQPVSIATAPVLVAGTATIGNTVPVPATSGGCSLSTTISTGAANQDATTVKGSAGQVYTIQCFNTTASARYVKFYNTASPTSASTPVIRLFLPAFTTGSGVVSSYPTGAAFGTAITFRVTTGAADNDTGAASTNDCFVNVAYL